MAFNVVEASLKDIQLALEEGTVTSVELVAAYLRRISIFDCRGPRLNSIPLINPFAFVEAAASDDRRAAGGGTLDALDGVPYTVKDSFKVKGMTVSAGASAFKDLLATEDAHTVHLLRSAGAVMLGKTNMPPMAAGGMQRGVYGRAESPYNTAHLAAAFGSGSSNGSAVATAASFAAFGLGEETVSSGRSPASNNALVAYTPSRGYISIRGNWPLYSTCDAVVPHARSVEDLFGVLDGICGVDEVAKGDFWRCQKLVSIPEPWEGAKPDSFYELRDGKGLETVRVAVPAMYIEDRHGVYVSNEVRELWEKARMDLESMGVEVVVVHEFPLVTDYEAYADPAARLTCGLPEAWKLVERGPLLALAWEEFLKDNADPNMSTLCGIEPERIWPYTDWEEPQLRYSEHENAIHWSRLEKYLAEFETHDPPVASQYDVPNLAAAVQALENMRKVLLEDWMTEHGFDFVVLPAAGDVGRADADVCHESAKHAWMNGVKYSNGNQALRHLGVPSVTVPMGMMREKKMPVGLTILGRGYDDLRILRFAWLVEQRCMRRVVPPLTPALECVGVVDGYTAPRPRLGVLECTLTYLGGTGVEVEVAVAGVVGLEEGDVHAPVLEVYVDGQLVPAANIKSAQAGNSSHSFSCRYRTSAPPTVSKRDEVEGKIARDMVMVVILARATEMGRPTGWLKLLDV